MLHPGLVDRVSLWLGERLSWLLLLAVLLTAYEVFMRYVMNAPTVWVHDLVIAITGVVFVFAGAYALQRDEHIRITSLYERAPAAARRVLDIVSLVLTLLYLALLTYAATRQASRSIGLVETSGHAWDVPIPMVMKTVLAVGAVLMAVQAAVLLLRTLRRR